MGKGGWCGLNGWKNGSIQRTLFYFIQHYEMKLRKFSFLMNYCLLMSCCYVNSFLLKLEEA